MTVSALISGKVGKCSDSGKVSLSPSLASPNQEGSVLKDINSSNLQA